MPNRILDSRLLAHAAVRQVEASVRADAAANRVANVFSDVWGEAMQLLTDTRAGGTPLSYHATFTRARDIFVKLAPQVEASLGTSILRIGLWGHQTAAKHYEETLPLGYLQVALLTPVKLREDVNRDAPGGIELGISGVDLTSKEQIAKTLFPAPSIERIEAVMAHPRMGRPWREQLRFATKLATPDRLAQILAQGVAAGKMPREIAEELLPHVDGNRVSATRITRTECLRVANQMKEDAASGIDSLIAGKQIHALFDIVTRPLHRARSGLKWMKDSGVDMQTALRMEWPTLPSYFNCRCHFSDLMRPPSWVADQKRMSFFTARANRLSPDNAVYADWFAKTDERQQRLAVGTRRFSAVKELLQGGRMHYEHFVGPDGKLLPLDRIRSETTEERLMRVQDLQKETAERRVLVRQIKTFGFLPPETAPAIPPAPVPKTPLPSPKPLEPHETSPWEPSRIANDQRIVTELLGTHDHKVRKQLLRSDASIKAVNKRLEKETEVAFQNVMAAMRTDTTAAELRALAAKAEGARDRHQQAIAQVKTKQRAALRKHLAATIADPVPVTHEIDEAITPMHPELVERVETGVKFLQGLVARQNEADHALHVVFVQIPADDPQQRAFARGGAVHLTRDSDVATVLHEIGHAIEYRYPTAARVARAFLKKRIGAQPLRKFKDLRPSWNYRKDEMGADDEFGKAFQGDMEAWYVGKFYAAGFTEILSMLLEKAYQAGPDLARKDPEMFALLIGILNGTMR